MRAGNFSSSAIWRLMSNGRAKESVGKPFTEYVKEKSYENRLGRQLENESYSKPTTWGNYAEQYAFDRMPFKYKLESQKRYFHKDLKYFCGAPDGISIDGVVYDIKCPYTMKSFCDLIESFESPERFKKEYPNYHWQLVANSILTGMEKAQLVVFIPNEKDLEEMQKDAIEYDGPDQWKYRFIYESAKSELPNITSEGYYKNVTIFSFDVTEEDKKLLIDRVKLASLELEKLIS